MISVNELAHRDASDLIVSRLGTNQAEWLHAGGAGMAQHDRIFGELLADARAASPSSSCLVVSPLDQLELARREHAAAQRRSPRWSTPNAAPRSPSGCAFWDAYRWMGGAGASRGWYARGLIVKDFQHPTTAGAELIGAALYRWPRRHRADVEPVASID